jgi:hypothetical protein
MMTSTNARSVLSPLGRAIYAVLLLLPALPVLCVVLAVDGAGRLRGGGASLAGGHDTGASAAQPAA